MFFPPLRRYLVRPSAERLLLAVLLILIALYAVVLLVQPSAVGRGGR
jgi:hypothetical protein